MPGFDAGTVVEPLNWSFRPHVDAGGTVREPTDQQIADFLGDIKKATAKVKDKLPEDVDHDDPVAVVSAMDDLDASAVVETHQELAGIFAALCSGSPSREQILGLPMRVRTVFYGWLQDEVMNPEAAPGAGSGQGSPQPLRVAG